ncbi:MAG: hypothetical protein K2L89_03385 [Muribaculaceae bacterium]|nr:hypothetical protein [Muribaculaceae bacterium]
MNRIFYIVGSLIFFSVSIGCTHNSLKTDVNDSSVVDSIVNDTGVNDTISNDSLALSEAETVIALDTVQIEKRVKEIWFKLRPEGEPSNNPAIPVLSSSLRPLYKKVYDAYKNAWDVYNSAGSNDEAMDAGMGLSEIIYGAWGGTEPDPKGKFKFKSIESISKDRVRIRLTYYNYSSPEDHQLELKYENGKWMLDEFDSFREELNYAINEPSFAPYFNKKTR